MAKVAAHPHQWYVISTFEGDGTPALWACSQNWCIATITTPNKIKAEKAAARKAAREEADEHVAA